MVERGLLTLAHEQRMFAQGSEDARAFSCGTTGGTREHARREAALRVPSTASPGLRRTRDRSTRCPAGRSPIGLQDSPQVRGRRSAEAARRRGGRLASSALRARVPRGAQTERSRACRAAASRMGKNGAVDPSSPRTFERARSGSTANRGRHPGRDFEAKPDRAAARSRFRLICRFSAARRMKAHHPRRVRDAAMAIAEEAGAILLEGYGGGTIPRRRADRSRQEYDRPATRRSGLARFAEAVNG